MLLTGLKRDLLRAEADPFNAARAFVVLEHLKSEFASFEAQIKTIHHIQATTVLPKLFEAAEVPSIPLNEGFKVEVKPKFFCSIPVAKKCAAHAWLKENGLSDIIQPEVNAKTLNSALQEHIQATGEEPPQELIKTYIAPVAKCVKTRVSKGLFDRDKPRAIFGELLAD